jgi:hypothetical protein
MIGKFLGTWGVVSFITLCMHAFIWIVVLVRGDATLGVTLTWGLRFWLVTLPIGAAWCGLVTFIGSLFRVPLIALLVTGGAIMMLWVVYLIGGLTTHHWMMYIYPNFYDKLLLSPRIDQVAAGFGGCLALVASTMGLGSYLFAKRDV